MSTSSHLRSTAPNYPALDQAKVLSSPKIPAYVQELREGQAAHQLGTAKQDPPIAPFETENGSWSVIIPKTGTSGQQQFTAPTLILLVGSLAKAQLHATRQIRYLTGLLKDGNRENDAQDFAVMPDF